MRQYKFGSIQTSLTTIKIKGINQLAVTNNQNNQFNEGFFKVIPTQKITLSNII
jgi:hypothetical protein